MLKPELTAVAQSILEQNYQSDEPALTLIPLKGGEWSAAYKFYYDSRSFVIRLSHTPENFYRDRIAAQWSSPSMPVPKIIKIDQYQGHCYAISPFFSGEPLELLSAHDLDKTIPAFLSMLTAMQEINLDSVEGFGTLTPAGQGAFNSWSEALLDVCNDRPDSLTHGWRKALAGLPRVQRIFDQFYGQLEKLVMLCPEQKRLIHMDLLYQNLLVEEHKITALLDWGCAMIGDPVYDFALVSFFEPWFPTFTQVDLVEKMQDSFLSRSPDNRENFSQRMMACQIHLTLGNIAYCIFSNREKDLFDHIDRLDYVLD